MFEVGQKVVCIFEFADVWKDWAIRDGVELPRKDSIYTIRSIHPSEDPTKDRVFLLLEEIRNPELACRRANGGFVVAEPRFGTDGFRPLVEQKTDISIFEKIDRDVFSKDRVDASLQEERPRHFSFTCGGGVRRDP